MIFNNTKLKIVFNNSARPQNLFFGPFCGELGWEIMRWAGMVRKICKMYPEKNIHIATRRNRRDLYSDVCSNLHLYDLDGDYGEYIPSCFNLYHKIKLGEVDKDFGKRWTAQFTEKFEQEQLPEVFYTVDPFKNKFDAFIFYTDYEHCDFDFQTTIENKKIISDILNQYKDKIPIMVFPRNRTDVYFDTLEDDQFQRRNWKENNWQTFFELLEKEDKYLVFISGIKGSAYHPLNEMNNLIILDKLETEKTSTLGLTIEAIKNSRITVSSQSSITVLSNLLKTKNLCFGNELHILDEYLNPFNNGMIYAKDNFDIDPKDLLKQLNTILL